MPVVGLGVWQIPNGPETENAVRWALELGYRHIDTAQAYENEESVGRALRDSGVPREEVFITTKFFPGYGGRFRRRRGDPAAQLEQSLRQLMVDQVDLYIIHWPGGGATWAWSGMEKALENGHTRAIGVSNFSAQELEQVMGSGSIGPVVDQVQFSPFEYRRKLLEYAAQRGVAIVAYSPLGTGNHLRRREVAEIAERVGRTPAQVLIRWCLQREAIVIPKSTHRERIEANGQVFDFELSEEDMAALDRLDETGGTDQARESKWW
jgi:diketogulonate reductase-like aldo/keto reductase